MTGRIEEPVGPVDRPVYDVIGDAGEPWPDWRGPVVDAPDEGRYLPEYPRCPDCGGWIEWAEAGRVPGSRECDGCGSTYTDARYGYAGEVPALDAGAGE